MVWAHKTSLTPPLIIKVPVPSQESDRSCIWDLVSFDDFSIWFRKCSDSVVFFSFLHFIVHLVEIWYYNKTNLIERENECTPENLYGNKYYQEVRVEIPLIYLTLTHVMPVPSQDLDFQLHMSLSLLCSISWGEW